MFSSQLWACALTCLVPDPEFQVLGGWCVLPFVSHRSDNLPPSVPCGTQAWGQPWLPSLTPQFHLLQWNIQHLCLQCCFLSPLGEFPSLLMGPTAQTALLKFTICWFSTLKHPLRIWVCSEMCVKHLHRIYRSCWRPSCKKNIAVSLFNAAPCLHLPAVSYFISGFPP